MQWASRASEGMCPRPTKGFETHAAKIAVRGYLPCANRRNSTKWKMTINPAKTVDYPSIRSTSNLPTRPHLLGMIPDKASELFYSASRRMRLWKRRGPDAGNIQEAFHAQPQIIAKGSSGATFRLTVRRSDRERGAAAHRAGFRGTVPRPCDYGSYDHGIASDCSERL